MEQAARNLPVQAGDVFKQIEKAKQEGDVAIPANSN